MTHLKNNGIALGVHALLAGIYFAIASAIRPMESSILYLIAFIVCFLGYVACGLFLLRPVEKSPFLSVLSVLGASLAAIFCIMFLERSNTETFFYYVYTNPIASIYYYCFPISISKAFELMPMFIFVSAFFPPLLMYLGMTLKRCFKKTSEKKAKNTGEWKTYLRNNGIALGVHILVIGVLFLTFFFIRRGNMVVSGAALSWCLFAFFLIAYVASGFFLLKPAKRNSFYSVLSVVIVLAGLLIYMVLFQKGVGILFIYMNPILLGYNLLEVWRWFSITAEELLLPNMMLFSVFLPSLLMYLGLVLKKCYMKLKRKKGNNGNIQAA